MNELFFFGLGNKNKSADSSTQTNKEVSQNVTQNIDSAHTIADSPNNATKVENVEGEILQDTKESLQNIIDNAGETMQNLSPDSLSNVFYEIMDKSLAFLLKFGDVMLKVLLILIAGYILSRVIAKRVKSIVLRKDEMLANFLSQFVFFAINIVFIIAILGTLGVQTNSLIAILSTIGIAIVLSLKDSLSSVASGIILLILRPFKIGDIVEFGNIVGEIENINLFSTNIRFKDGRLAIVPNVKLSIDSIINTSKHRYRRLELRFGVGYDSDCEYVKTLVKNVLKTNKFVYKVEAPFVGLINLGDSALEFITYFWIDIQKHNSIACQSSVLEDIKKTLDEHGISIPFNQLDVYIKPESENVKILDTKISDVKILDSNPMNVHPSKSKVK